MKKLALLITGLLLLSGSHGYCDENPDKNFNSTNGTIKILSTPELYNLINNWANAYTQGNPGSEIKLISTERLKIADLSESGADLGFVTGDYALEGEGADTWKMAIGREVVIPVMSSDNPFREIIIRKGMTVEMLSSLLSDPEQRDWDKLVGDDQHSPVHLYILNDDAVIKSVGRIISTGQVSDKGINYMDADVFIASIKADPFALGICLASTVLGDDEMSMTGGMAFLPLDKNGNGKIDYMEQIYDNPEAFNRGVWIGKYPRVLVNDIYCVSENQPSNAMAIAFIRWGISSGQKFLPGQGYSELVLGERQSKLASIYAIGGEQMATQKSISLGPLLFILLVAIVLAGLVYSFFIYFRKDKSSSIRVAEMTDSGILTGSSVTVPKGLYYDKTHTWAFMEKDGMVKIGIDDFLQHLTGPITRVEMCKPGERIKKGDSILTIIQNGKRLVLYAPLSGVIIENNKLLRENSSRINTSPYADGWVYRLEPANWSREIQFMEMAEKYKEWLNQEFARLKEFFAYSIKIDKAELEAVVLQDGGTLKDNILEDFGPEVWEDFQHHFLDE